MELIIAAAVILILVGWLIPSPLSWLARRKVQAENRSLREHLHTKMQIDSEGARHVMNELEQLKKVNTNLRITIETLKHKPGRAELRQLYVYDRAISIMRERVPGFASTWERVLAHAEKDYEKTDVGIGAFVKKIFRPSAVIGQNKNAASNDGQVIDAVIANRHDTQR